MTGNVVFLGFALAGASGLSAPASIAALGAFLAGAVAGGRIASHWGGHRGRQLRAAAAVALVPVLLAIDRRGRSSASRSPKAPATH